MIKEHEAIEIAKKLNVIFDKFSLEDFIIGLNIELEHGIKDPQTNITNNDLEMTAKITLAHLNEHNNYYNKEYGLPAFEKSLENK